MFRFCLALLAAGFLISAAPAHYNMLLPDTAMAKKGDKVGFVYQFGHPFEHELFDAPQPTLVVVRLPDGKAVDLTKKLEKFKKPGGVDGKEVTAFRFEFTPEQRGDYWFVLETPPIWMEESKEFYQDTVQVCLHVQTQHGWDKLGPDIGGKQFQFQFQRPLLMEPLTRPYGLLPGMVFQALAGEALIPGQPDLFAHPRCFRYHRVEIERFNPQRPKEIPPDELVTFQVKHDPKGVFTCTLTEPGWWCMTVQREADQPKKDSDGKNRTVYQRTTLWVHVETKAASK